MSLADVFVWPERSLAPVSFPSHSYLNSQKRYHLCSPAVSLQFDTSSAAQKLLMLQWNFAFNSLVLLNLVKRDISALQLYLCLQWEAL